ncbi:Glycosyltransferase family 92 protein [Quillaja saponaria]|uniref:Glycosyltransferase family 92 protein n=1 Tax=Quillaja saponaria TaxID=32244 RepID=A0AAD7LZK9_QUISA|nr:Glycosyltransferase family 92 protein [Quillaja saponaria]
MTTIIKIPNSPPPSPPPTRNSLVFSNSIHSPNNHQNPSSCLSVILSFLETMRRRPRATFLITALTILLFAAFSLHLSRNAISGDDLRWYPGSNFTTPSKHNDRVNYVVRENVDPVEDLSHRSRRVTSIRDSIDTVSVLIPDWEILVIVSLDTPLSPNPADQCRCLFQNNATSPARFSGVLPFTNQTTFKCVMPDSVKRRRPFFQPILTKSAENEPRSPGPELLRWTFLAYESFSTEDDVVLFVKGVNHRQGINMPPQDFRCVFGYGTDDAVKTPVTSSIQEVFRCQHPKLSGGNEKMKMSLEIIGDNLVVPSVAYYTGRRTIANSKPKSLVCACTMVHNVGKFLREWVMYHSKIGVEKFILYDNNSDDDLESVIKKLDGEGYDVSSVFWIWPKTQESGFSHSALYAKDWCTWMTYVDVDEFIFSPLWQNSTHPSNLMLHSLLPPTPQQLIGQVSIHCNEFGPSGQRSHPIQGVTQGYTCRRRVEQRHKSMVLLDAVEESLLNVVHHFKVKENFMSKQISLEEGVVNHYKYQAWPEFRRKFRRRVSAYVVDWTEAVNPMSKDRTPGLGFEPVEPEGWADKFCEVVDERLKSMTERWFGSLTRNGYTLAWQR